MTEEKKTTFTTESTLKEMILKIQRWYQFLRSKWLIVIIAGCIGGALGLIYAILKKPEYTATLTFALEEKTVGGTVGAYSSFANQLGINLGGGRGGVFSEDNIIQLMKSRKIITKALLSGLNVDGKEESMANYYILVNNLNKKWRNSPTDLKVSFSINTPIDSLSYIQDSLIGVFYNKLINKSLSIDKPDKKSGIISVSCVSSSELFAKCFVEALVKNVSLFYIQTKTKRSLNVVATIQNRLDSIIRVYNAALYGTAASSDLNLNPVRAITEVPRIRNQTKSEILGTEYGELVKNLEIAKMAVLQETPLIQVIDKPILPLPKTAIGKVKGSLIGSLIFVIFSLVVSTSRFILNDIFSDPSP